jgi:hypothetical protein
VRKKKEEEEKCTFQWSVLRGALSDDKATRSFYVRWPEMFCGYVHVDQP